MTTIRFSGLELRFLRDRHETAGSLDMFEMTVQPRALMPVAHYHETWDEAVYGLVGTTTWRIAGRDVAVGPRETAYIPRGVVHGFRNDSDAPATCLSILTPGILGPEYFQAMAEIANSGAPDPERMRGVMVSYGLIPSAEG